jgi:hypothetical protein
VPTKRRPVTDDPNPPDDRQDATAAFVWPPPDEANPIEVIEFGSEVLSAPAPRHASWTEDRLPEANLRANPAQTWVPPLDPALSLRISTAPERAFDRELETEVRPPRPAPVEPPPPPVRRVPTSEPPPVSRNRSRLLTALVVVTALAAAEALYILRSGAGPEPEGIAAAEPEPSPAAAGGALEVSSTPPGALVQIDGRDAGVTPITLDDLPPGPHRIVLTAKGRQPVAQQVTIEAGATVKVIAPLLRLRNAAAATPPPAPAPTLGALMISSPLDMEIREDGELLGRTGGNPPTLPAGDHTLHLTDATTGYAVVQRVRISAGRTTRMTVTPPKRRVNINALPWATVAVDGETVGETPIGALSLSLGSHVLVFSNPTLGERTMTAIVTTDGPNNFSVDLRK